MHTHLSVMPQIASEGNTRQRGKAICAVSKNIIRKPDWVGKPAERALWGPEHNLRDSGSCCSFLASKLRPPSSQEILPSPVTFPRQAPRGMKQQQYLLGKWWNLLGNARDFHPGFKTIGCEAHLFQCDPNFVKQAQEGQRGLQPLEMTEVNKSCRRN